VFRNLSGDPERDYFCEGMTEEIIGRLSTIKNLKVTSMQSMLRFKETDLDLKKIGKELGVSNVLEGSIQVSGENIRVRAQLIRVEDDAHIWTEKYDRALQDVFAIQDEISRSIADVLETQLVTSGASIVSRHGTENIEAYNAYVRGRHFFRNRIDDDLAKAIEQFEIAIDLDPNYAQAWSGLADAWWVRPQYGNVTEKIAFPKVDSAARIALELGPGLAEAHASWAHALNSIHGRREDAERELLRAIDLNPGYSWAHMWYGNHLRATGGDPLLELRHLRLAVELDPVSVPALGNLAYYYRRQGDLEEAERLCRRQITLEPTFINAYWNLAYTQLRQGDTAGVSQTLDSMMHYAPDVWQAYSHKGDLLVSLGRFEEAELAYREAAVLAPDNWQPHHYLGVFLTEMRGEYREGDSCFLKAIALDSTQPLPHSRYGHSLRLQGRTDEMIEHLRMAMELAPYAPEMYRAYGWAIGPGLGLWEEAIEYMQKALELNPRHTRTLISISLMYAYEGRFDEAHAAIDKSIELDQGNSFALRRKADIFVMAGLYDSALAWYSRYHTTSPADTYVLYRLLILNGQLGRDQAADSCYEIMASSPDPNTRAWARRLARRPLLSQGKISAAIAKLEEGIHTDSLELGSCNEMLYKYNNIIDLMLLLSTDHNSTLEYVDRAKRLSAAVDSRTALQDAVLVAYAGLAWAKAGEARRGIRMIQNALNDPEYTAATVQEILWHYLARAYIASGQFDEATDMMRRPLRQDSSFLNQMFLGYTFLQADNSDSAIVWLERALATWDEDRLINTLVEPVLVEYYMGLAYESAGRNAEAVEQYETFLDIWKDADEGLESVIDAKARLALLRSD
jgi:serine/threonine-protein kinase